MVAEHMANVEREKYPELMSPDWVPSSPVPGKSTEPSDLGDADSGYSDG